MKKDQKSLLSLSKSEFFTAAEDGCLERVEEGLRAYPEWAREKDEDGYTALLSAVYFGRADCVKALLPHSDANAKTSVNNSTALMLAAEAGGMECAMTVLGLCDVRAINSQGESALMLAAHSGGEQLVRALLPLSDPDARSASGFTALMMAASAGEFECVKALLPHSDLSVACKKRELSALGWAQSRGAWRCADLLAAAESERCARRLRSEAPKNIALPLSEALIEHSELESATREAASLAPGAKKKAALSRRGARL